MSDKIEHCTLCGSPTGRCGDDSIHIEASDDVYIGPLCDECVNGIVHWVASDACISPNQQALAAKDAELATANEELQEWRNVIAIICCDGGHYHQEHGTKATAEYCKQTVCGDRDSLAAANEQIEELQETVTDWRRENDAIIADNRKVEELRAENRRLQTLLNAEMNAYHEASARELADKTENAALKARIAELEGLLAQASDWIDSGVVMYATGDFLRHTILKALSPQPKETQP